MVTIPPPPAPTGRFDSIHTMQRNQQLQASIRGGAVLGYMPDGPPGSGPNVLGAQRSLLIASAARQFDGGSRRNKKRKRRRSQSKKRRGPSKKKK